MCACICTYADYAAAEAWYACSDCEGYAAFDASAIDDTCDACVLATLAVMYVMLVLLLKLALPVPLLMDMLLAIVVIWM
jgi:hypothetical protein